MAKRMGIDGALKQARSKLYGEGGPKEDALRSTYRAPSALPAAAMAVNTLADKDLWSKGGPAEDFSERRRQDMEKAQEVQSQLDEMFAAGRHAEAAELLASVAADRDIPKYMPGDSELGGGSVAMPWAGPAESLQDARFAAEQSARASRGRSEYLMDSLGGMLGAAAVSGGMLAEGLPGSSFTEPVRDRYWRSDVGRANTMPVRTRRVPISATRRALANSRAIARETSKRILPLAGPSPYAAPVLSTALAAAPLLAAPLNFVFGEGEGSYAQTQDFKSQVDTLARHKGSPLDVRDLEPEFFERLAGEPGIAEALIQSGTLSDESIDELGYWQGRARERDEAGEVARLRSLGMLDSEDDDVARGAMDPMTRDLVQRQGMALDMMLPFERGDFDGARVEAEERLDEHQRQLELGEAGIQPTLAEIQRERQMAEDAERNPAGFDAWSEGVRRPYGE